MKKVKNYVGFRIPKIWQIFKNFARSLHFKHTKPLCFWRVPKYPYNIAFESQTIQLFAVFQGSFSNFFHSSCLEWLEVYLVLFSSNAISGGVVFARPPNLEIILSSKFYWWRWRPHYWLIPMNIPGWTLLSWFICSSVSVALPTNKEFVTIRIEILPMLTTALALPRPVLGYYIIFF